MEQCKNKLTMAIIGCRQIDFVEDSSIGSLNETTLLPEIKRVPLPPTKDVEEGIVRMDEDEKPDDAVGLGATRR